MKLPRLYLSEARFHYSQWLDWRGRRALVRGLAMVRKADRIRHHERLCLGIDELPLGAARAPKHGMQ